MRGLGTLGVAVLALMLFGVTAGPASATTGHAYAGSFGIQYSLDPGGFAGDSPTGLAIRQSTGDVYAADANHKIVEDPQPRIERFDTTGTFQSEFNIDPALYNTLGALALDPGGPWLYAGVNQIASSTGVVLKYSTAGVLDSVISPSAGRTFSQRALAANPVNGDLYVGATDPGTGKWYVEVFDNTGAPVTSFDGATNSPDGAFQTVGSIAVDGNGDVYVADPDKVQGSVQGRVDRYSAAGVWEATVDDGSRGAPVTVAADPVSNEIYVLNNRQTISWFTAGGAAWVDTFGAGSIATGYGLAVESATGKVFAADAGSGLGRMFVEFPGPTVATTGSTPIDSSSQTLEGTIDPEGVASDYYFEYGLDTNYGASTPPASAGNGNSPVPVSDTATGLQPNTQYHFRIVGTTTDGVIYGNDQTFTSATAPPTVDAGGGAPPTVSNIKPDGVTVTGTVNPNNSDTAWHFDYGLTTAYGSTAPSPAGQTGVSLGDMSVTTDITGLQPDTTYHYRLSADNGTGGAQNGVDQTFTTAPATAAGATDITALTATLTGVVNPRGTPAEYRFEYGPSPSYGTNTDWFPAGDGAVDLAVTRAVTRLEPGTTYYVRLVARDITTQVTTTGVAGTFDTDPAPSLTTGAVTGVGTDRATFKGTVNTHGLAGTYRFYVESTTSTYIGKTAEQSVSANSAPATVTGTLTDLVPGQTYTVRLGATSSGVTSYGDTVTFSTAPLPVIAPPAPPATVNNPYGCTAPALAAYNPHPKPGDTITIAGKDLGVGGTVALGDQTIKPTNWSATGFSIVLPDDATGTLPLTVNCGTVTNTIAIQMYKAPSNSFTATGTVKGSTATLKVKVPGPGAISITGGSVKKATKRAGKASTVSVKVSLSAKGKKSVKRHKKLAVSLTVRFTPNGGTTSSKTVRVTFKR